METILKFIKNSKQSEDSGIKNQVLSRTLLKICVISKFVLENCKDSSKLPKDGELWRVRIVKESRPGKNTGCFICEPIKQVQENDLVKLVPGTFDIKLIDAKLIIRPKKEYNGQSWIMPLQHKQLLAQEHNAYCLIVDLDSSPVEMTPQTHGN